MPLLISAPNLIPALSAISPTSASIKCTPAEAPGCGSTGYEGSSQGVHD